MQAKPQYLHVLATRASSPTSLQHSGWTATLMLGGPIRRLDMVCCRWPASLIDTELITALTLSSMLNGITLLLCPGRPCPPGHTAAPLTSIRCGNAELHTQNPPGITKKQFFSIVKANTEAAWRSAGIQRPLAPHPFSSDAVLRLLLRKLEQKKQWKTCLAPIS